MFGLKCCQLDVARLSSFAAFSVFVALSAVPTEVHTSSPSAPGLDAVAQQAGCARSSEVETLDCLFEQWYRSADGRATVGWQVAGVDVPRGLTRSSSGTYGEISPAGVSWLIAYVGELAALGEEDVFVDLGSGRGRVVFQVALTTPARAVGIELSVERHSAAMAAASSLAAMAPKLLSSKFHFVLRDIREPAAWSNATLVWLNSLSFAAELALELSNQLAANLLPGTLLFTNRKLPGCARGLRLVHSERSVPASWSVDGMTVHVYIVVPIVALGTEGDSALGAEAVFLNDRILDPGGSCPALVQRHWGVPSEHAAVRLCKVLTDGHATQLSWPDIVSLLHTHVAEAVGFVKCAWLELAARQDVEVVDVVAKDRGLVASFISSFGDPSLRDTEGWTLLHHAATWHKPEAAGPIVAQLLRARADPSVTLDDGTSILDFATSRCSGHEVLEVLIHGGANVNLADFRGLTPLHRLAACESSAITSITTGIKSLLKASSDVNALDDSGQSPLHMAVSGMVATVLLEARASSDRHDEEGQTPLHKAINRARLRGCGVVSALLEQRADPDARDRRGLTPLMLTRDVGSATALVSARANAHALSEGQVDALHRAARYAEAAVVDVLAAAGMSVDGRMENGMTPLHMAAAAGHVGAVEILLGRRADISARGTGRTPLHLAAKSGHAAVVECLLKVGADATARDDRGLKARDLAESAGARGMAVLTVLSATRPEL